jgi:hypothetical protein
MKPMQPAQPAEPAKPAEPVVEFRWDGFAESDPDADEALYRITENGGAARFPVDSQRGFAFIPIIVGAIAVVGLAKAIKSFIDDMKTGVVIDNRGEQVKISKDKNLGRGTVLFVNKDGTLRLENPDAEKLGDIVKAAVEGIKK